MNNTILLIAICTILAVYVGYTTYESIKLYIDSNRKLDDFLKQEKHAEKISGSPLWTVLCIVLAAGALVMSVLSGNINGAGSGEITYYRIAYVAISLLMVGLAFETIVRNRCYVIKDGFFYVDKKYRFRSIKSIEQKKGIFKKYQIVFNDSSVIEMSNKIGQELQNRKDQWRKDKKEKKK
ncbi:MAG: hypothetical protein J6E46_02560 [Faecalicoccus sp.]|nr:hypothetical protein [Faecalicoccus sp.]